MLAETILFWRWSCLRCHISNVSKRKEFSVSTFHYKLRELLQINHQRICQILSSDCDGFSAICRDFLDFSWCSTGETVCSFYWNFRVRSCYQIVFRRVFGSFFPDFQCSAMWENILFHKKSFWLNLRCVALARGLWRRENVIRVRAYQPVQ
jgi:hypothetical protein